MASAIETTPAKSTWTKWSMRIPVRRSQVATVQPGPPRPKDRFVIISLVLAGYASSSSGSTHLGNSTMVSRGMLTTEMLLRSAERWTSICTSASGLAPTLALCPPSLRFSAVLRLSEPITRTFRGVCPAAFGVGLAARCSPRLRSSFLMLSLRCR
ncbi:hypothetical protein SFUMM280S_01044 [Streptomyces fumanus]